MSKIAIVTGANRGLGFGTAEALAKQGYTVALTGRDRKRLEAAAASLKSQGREVVCFLLDPSDDRSVHQFADAFARQFDHVDALVNNAGALFRSPNGTGLFEADPLDIERAFRLNSLGALRMLQALKNLLLKSPAPRVVNVSTGMGQLSDMGGGHVAYRMSKTALNAFTRIAASELKDTKLKINSVCPGWVRTDMGGPNATRDLAAGIAGIVWAATLPDDGPSGGFFRDGEPIPW
jgi:NAD(P)-dependent dehydrogenase (short-subunit alcohol dehydrogenase family)